MQLRGRVKGVRKQTTSRCYTCSGIILCRHPANERWRYAVTPSLISWAHTQNDACMLQSLMSVPRNISRWENVLKTTFSHGHWIFITSNPGSILADHQLFSNRLQGLTLMPMGISNHTPSKVWDEITYPFTNFNGQQKQNFASLGLDKWFHSTLYNGDLS